MILEVSIRKKLGNFSLNVSFSSDTAVLAILGASGCGKSMTLKCIAGIETPDSGRIVLNDRVLFDSDQKINLPPQKRKVGYMFQDYALFPNMTVRRNIEIARAGKPLPEDYMTRFHLEGLEEHYPAQLSGGQKQRTAMARMLAAEPELILLDEPFSALDAHLKWALESEVKQILREISGPALFVSHNRDEVYRLCDKVGAMTDGRLSEMIPVREFFHNPKTRAAAVLSGCKNVSAAVRTDEHHLFVPGWNVMLETDRPVPFEKGYAGIRAHRFEPVYEPEYEMENAGCEVSETSDGARAEKPKDECNLFRVSAAEPTEDPFEWNVAFRPAGGSEWIQWKISKDLWNYGRNPMPAAFRIAPENILILNQDDAL